MTQFAESQPLRDAATASQCSLRSMTSWALSRRLWVLSRWSRYDA